MKLLQDTRKPLPTQEDISDSELRASSFKLRHYKHLDDLDLEMFKPCQDTMM